MAVVTKMKLSSTLMPDRNPYVHTIFYYKDFGSFLNFLSPYFGFLNNI